MADQPLLRNRPWKLPNVAKERKIRAIIQGRQSKAHMCLPISD